MHNSRLVDPLDPIVEQLSEIHAKKRKTKADHLELSHLQFLGGIYFDPSVGPFVPALNLQRCLIEGARLTRDGKKIERGVFLEDVMIGLRYEGPRDVEALFAEKRHVHRVPIKVQMNRVMRTRPKFPEWHLRTTGIFDDSVLDFEELQRAAKTAGTMIGLGDGRPTYGRFQISMEAMDS